MGPIWYSMAPGMFLRNAIVISAVASKTTNDILKPVRSLSSEKEKATHATRRDDVGRVGVASRTVTVLVTPSKQVSK